MAKGETYEEFVEKFKPKLTTDDCYTPPDLFEAVKNYVVERWGIDESKIIRPFKPNGDYKAEDYTDKVVLDNPPFSIASEIWRYFSERGIPFFLWKNGLTLQKEALNHHVLVTGREMYATNGARVPCDFITNLSGKPCVEACPELAKILKDHFPDKQSYPVLKLPRNILRASDFGKIAKQGLALKVDNFERVTKLSEYKKGVFGGAIIVSDLIAEEYEKAKARAEEKAKAREQITPALDDKALELIRIVNSRE